ncbi:hypothetical protein L1987_00917 [Smallanthus sonchifolius]|uniref:Uncharacterized protein n=1 Tax=Smallanthus sonchifolius TaxID=185202 RepID=A0ACB9K3K1_9ASTR|nr:hypothetical protein L1987_00917 [Smallanthus sonchifolius]
MSSPLDIFPFNGPHEIVNEPSFIASDPSLVVSLSQDEIYENHHSVKLLNTPPLSSIPLHIPVELLNTSPFSSVPLHSESFDATYQTNKYNMTFVPFTGVDHNKQCVIFGAGLLHSETIESYKWLLESFLKAHGKQPKLVLTDQDPSMRQAISQVFTESRHMLCMWHIMKKLPAKVSGDLFNNVELIPSQYISQCWKIYVLPKSTFAIERRYGVNNSPIYVMRNEILELITECVDELRGDPEALSSFSAQIREIRSSIPLKKPRKCIGFQFIPKKENVGSSNPLFNATSVSPCIPKPEPKEQLFTTVSTPRPVSEISNVTIHVITPSLPSNPNDDPWLGYDPFDSEWALNFNFNQVALNNPVITPVNPHLINPLPVTKEDEVSGSSTHSLNTLLGWANHNPQEDELSTDDESLSNYY